MKKIAILAAALTFSFGVYAQNSTSGKMEKEHKMEKDKMSTDKKMKPHYEMMNGKMMETKDGKSTKMTSEATLDNGAVLMTDGTVKMKDGSVKKVKEGDCIYKDGKIEKMEKKEGDKMEKKDDSKMEKKEAY